MIDNDVIRALHDDFKILEKKIKEYDNIVIYRHESPDGDALGAQYGLARFIKDNFQGKEVHCVGDRHRFYMPSLFPYPEELDESFYQKKHLAITVDVANKVRIAANHIQYAAEVIKIDHHPLPAAEERFGDVVICYPQRPAASEIIALFALSRRKLKLHAQAASYLYCGIVTDTGRFSYQDTDSGTFRIAASLLDCGADGPKLSSELYRNTFDKLELLKECLNNYHLTKEGVCYYILTKETLAKLGADVNMGNINLNYFRDLAGVKVAMSVTWDEGHQRYRISLRSAKVKIGDVAFKFNGGGHDFAAGCNIKSLDELGTVLSVLNEI